MTATTDITDAPERAVPPIALAIAGSEASGGAGAQTDLKTFHQLGVFGCTALTCIVSMDPKAGWDHRFVPVDPQVIHDQIEACATVHTAIDAVKVGMLGTAATIDVVDAALEEYRFHNVVLDPVLICKGQEFGTALEVDNALRSKILPRATMTTPNLFESATLAGMEEITSVAQLKDAAKRITTTASPMSWPRRARVWEPARHWTSSTTARFSRSSRSRPSGPSGSTAQAARSPPP